ncbi:MAG: hypothetical protein ACXVCE_12170 [Bacteriovorax sp.]
MKVQSVMLAFQVALFSIVALASTDPKIEAVPAPGKTKVDSTSSLPADTGLIKTEKTIVDKNCRMVHGKVKCDPKKKRIKRKTID